jgi:N-methylhydantoinase B
MTVRGVSREAVIADNGVVLTGELDDDSMLYAVAATSAASVSGPAPAEVLSDWGPGYARLFGGVSYADVEVVGS